MLDDPYNEGGRGATAGRVRLKGCRPAVDGTRAGASAPGRWNDPAGGALWGSRRKGGGLGATVGAVHAPLVVLRQARAVPSLEGTEGWRLCQRDVNERSRIERYQAAGRAHGGARFAC
jgi:hypothetical protein